MFIVKFAGESQALPSDYVTEFRWCDECVSVPVGFKPKRADEFAELMDLQESKLKAYNDKKKAEHQQRRLEFEIKREEQRVQLEAEAKASENLLKVQSDNLKTVRKKQQQFLGEAKKALDAKDLELCLINLMKVFELNE